jgi:hypothetical protein
MNQPIPEKKLVQTDPFMEVKRKRWIVRAIIFTLVLYAIGVILLFALKAVGVVMANVTFAELIAGPAITIISSYIFVLLLWLCSYKSKKP